VQGTGIGPTLRKARLIRGKSIEEASRDTRIRTEYLHALERERFDALLGDVYVRGCLRSYSTYLGLDADRVLTVYNRHFGAPRPAPEDLLSGRRRPLHRAGARGGRHRPSWAVLAGAAVAILAVLGVAGLLSRARSSPPAESLTGPPPVVAPDHSSVVVAIQATKAVGAAVSVDGARILRFLLRPDETRTFAGSASIEVVLDHGGMARLIVNGYSMGAPGRVAAPFTAMFGPESFRSAPSQNAH
jgi:hypothetical protein